jgi:c-di-GMP-binding flagellar brake protein YcgR
MAMQLDTHVKATAATAVRLARKHRRTLHSVPVTLRHLIAGGVRKARGITLDISEGGLAVLMQGELSVGDTVEIDLSLAGCTLSLVAIVRHSSSMRTGFEFVDLTPEQQVQIANATASN